MENAIEITALHKDYGAFALQDINLKIPRGCVTGFIGENGAGKSTTLKAILNLIHFDGEISVFGLDSRTHEHEIKQRIGVVLEDGCFPSFFTAQGVSDVLKAAYPGWEQKKFDSFLSRFRITPKQKISEYSKGMRMKLCIAAALSHGAELLILDEPTSGLDPIVRDEVLDLFWEFLQDERHSILMSSHITSDLDKIADHIALIHDGRLLLSMPRDALIETYGLLRLTADQLHALDPKAIVATRSSAFSTEALVLRASVPQSFAIEQVNIEQIMLFMTRGQQS